MSCPEKVFATRTAQQDWANVGCDSSTEAALEVVAGRVTVLDACAKFMVEIAQYELQDPHCPECATAWRIETVKLFARTLPNDVKDLIASRAAEL